MPLAVVLGATGVQGGGVVQALLEDGSTKVRALSRKTDSESAKSLVNKVIPENEIDRYDGRAVLTEEK